MKYRGSLKELQGALSYADAEKDQLQERNADVEHQLTGARLALHVTEQQLTRLKAIVEHYQIRYPRAPLPPDLEQTTLNEPTAEGDKPSSKTTREEALSVTSVTEGGDGLEEASAVIAEDSGESDAETYRPNRENVGQDEDEEESAVKHALPPFSPGGMSGRPSSAFNAKVKLRVTPAEAALLARARQVGGYLERQGDKAVLKEEALKLLEYVVKEQLPLLRVRDAQDGEKENTAQVGLADAASTSECNSISGGSKARDRLAEAQKQDKKVDRAINWAEFMSGISAFQAGGREVRATIQARLQEERDERAREGHLGVSGHNFK